MTYFLLCNAYSDVNKASKITAKAKDLALKAKAIDININEAVNVKVK
jgi:hypothetical protein